jgi:CMP-N-acetylneuraminic acid synthetase
VGVPRKNIRPLLGKPLIAYTIEQALACPQIDAVYVSTDDEEIAAVARQYGAIVPFKRPAELATSEAVKLPVIQHLVDYLAASGQEFSRIVDLQPTSPLRLPEDITAVLTLLDDKTDVVITGSLTDKNPYFSMVERKPDGNFGLVATVKGRFATRQAAPPVYAMNGSIYAWHRETLALGLWGGRVQLHVMPPERSVDIDSEIDFRLCELILSEARGK